MDSGADHKTHWRTTMPHLDALLLRTPVTSGGESRFARPVAAITGFVRRWTGATGKAFNAAKTPRIRQDLETRALEDYFGRASDFADFGRMERDHERRDAGGIRSWD
jgi:hypothetical protein